MANCGQVSFTLQIPQPMGRGKYTYEDQNGTSTAEVPCRDLSYMNLNIVLGTEDRC